MVAPAGRDRAIELLVGFAVLGMGDFGKPPAHELRLRIAQQARELRIALHEPSLHVHDGHADGGVLENRAEHGLAVAQGGFHPGPLQVRGQHVGKRADQRALLRQERPLRRVRPRLQIGDFHRAAPPVSRRDAGRLHPRRFAPARRSRFHPAPGYARFAHLRVLPRGRQERDEIREQAVVERAPALQQPGRLVQQRQLLDALAQRIYEALAPPRQAPGACAITTNARTVPRPGTAHEPRH